MAPVSVVDGRRTDSDVTYGSWIPIGETNWIRDVQKQSQMEIQSDESAIQSDGSLGSDVPAETIVYYT